MRTLRPLILAAFGALLQACAASESVTASGGGGGGGEGDGGGGGCEADEAKACACERGGEGLARCDARSGVFGPCEGCEPVAGCGDGACSPGEGCRACSADCGDCAPCTIAPACEGANVPPSAPAHAGFLDVKPGSSEAAGSSGRARGDRLARKVEEGGLGVRALAAALAAPRGEAEHPFVAELREAVDEHPVPRAALEAALERAGWGSAEAYRAEWPLRGDEAAPAPRYEVREGSVPPGGTEECGAPRLRVRVASVTVHENKEEFKDDEVYCLVSAEADRGGEIRVTPKTPNLDSGDTHAYSLEAGIVWGQIAPRTPGGNLLLTYDCIESDSAEEYVKLLDSIAQRAEKVGAIFNENEKQGWVFEVAGEVAPIVAEALALNGDDHLFNAQQVIDAARQLELTRGAYWTVRRSGSSGGSEWDWELRMEAWGCADFGTL